MTIVLERIETRAQLKADETWWQIYREAFPSVYQVSVDRLSQMIDKPMMRFYRGTRHGQTIGLVVTQLLVEPEAVFVDYFAVHAAARRSGAGRVLLSECIRAGLEELEAMGRQPFGTVLEVELGAERGKRSNAETWYRRQGFRSLVFRYRQPPLDGREAVPMRLLFRPLADGLILAPTMRYALIKGIYRQTYAAGYGVEQGALDEELRLCAKDLGLADSGPRPLLKSS